jgi:hypothetical protein
MANQRAVNDPAVQKIFDDIVAFMGVTYNSVNTTTTMDGTGTRQYINNVAVDGSSWNYQEFSPGVTVSVTPPNASLGPAATQQFTATAKNPDGSLVATPVYVWSALTGALGTIDSTGLYTAPATVAANSVDQLRCGLQGTQAYASFQVSLHP